MRDGCEEGDIFVRFCYGDLFRADAYETAISEVNPHLAGQDVDALARDDLLALEALSAEEHYQAAQVLLPLEVVRVQMRYQPVLRASSL